MSVNGKEDLDLVNDDDDDDNDNDNSDDNGDKSDDEGYEVEAILASEWLDVDGGYRYHVKWKGGEKTWEPEENLDGSAELLSEVWSRKRKKATKKQVQPRKRAKSTR
ncbi:MAG: hypothetical protein Q9188_005580 [Gyalolechia gomerana]